MRAVVLAGGEGRRLRPTTLTVPKPLVPVDGVPILHIILTQLRSAGFTHVSLSLGYRARMIEASLADDRWSGLDLDFFLEEEPLGTAGPLTLLPPFEDSTLVMNADLLTDTDFADLVRCHRKSRAAATVALSRQGVDLAHGVVELDQERQVTSFREKPRLSFLASGGIYVLEPSVPRLLAPRARCDMPALLERARAAGERVEGHVIEGDWHDIGTPEQLERATAAFRADRARYVGRPRADIGALQEAARP
ncbi:sugar phosphate nucleotidyltransferase [Streptomyces niveiscabiei]|uniref:sugar phosphate nucleotidyltransferase n=1 Tax=Streptomyces niveiscabiei TaxID=164115 RepID=UPI0029B0BCE6|nr:sugar phosphate nucleotidyltransferase [Streptomyces niveiscabiei]MDX3382458.1 sugar phosphate nucleotidyltransferase [Streptomyces niveiscabiei]